MKFILIAVLVIFGVAGNNANDTFNCKYIFRSTIQFIIGFNKLN